MTKVYIVLAYTKDIYADNLETVSEICRVDRVYRNLAAAEKRKKVCERYGNGLTTYHVIQKTLKGRYKYCCSLFD